MNYLRIKLDYVIAVDGEPSDGLRALPHPFPILDVVESGIGPVVQGLVSILPGTRVSLSVHKPRGKRP